MNKNKNPKEKTKSWERQFSQNGWETSEKIL